MKERYQIRNVRKSEAYTGSEFNAEDLVRACVGVVIVVTVGFLLIEKQTNNFTAMGGAGGSE